MLTLSVLSVALVIFSAAALSVDKRQADEFIIPESCESVCTVLGQIFIRVAYGDLASTCTDTTSSEITTCLACAVNADPSAFTADVHDRLQTAIDDYVAACLAVGATITPPTLGAPTSDKSTGAEPGTNAVTSTNAASTTAGATDTLTKAATTGTGASASASSTGAAVNLKAPTTGFAPAIAFVSAFLA